MFVYNFFPPQTFIHQQYETIPKQNNLFKLIVHRIELHAAFEERENKQKNANFFIIFLELSFFSHKNASVMQFYGQRKITLNFAMFIIINRS